MSNSTVTLFYRDGGNYKFTVEFIVEDALIAAAKAKYTPEEWEDQEDANILYTDLGITQDQFHEEIGWAYDDEDDHPYVIVEKVEAIPEETTPAQANEKFVIAYDTLCEGHQTCTDDEGNPVLYDSYRDAFIEMFDDAAEAIRMSDTPNANVLLAMDTLLVNEDYEGMKVFWESCSPRCNPNEEWVESTNTFLLGRKAIFGNEGLQVEGEKI